MQAPTPTKTAPVAEDVRNMRATYVSVILVELLVLSALWIFQEYFSR